MKNLDWQRPYTVIEHNQVRRNSFGYEVYTRVIYLHTVKEYWQYVNSLMDDPQVKIVRLSYRRIEYVVNE